MPKPKRAKPRRHHAGKPTRIFPAATPAETLVAIASAYVPPPVIHEEPPAPEPISRPAVPAKSKRAPRACTRCHQLGHNRTTCDYDPPERIDLIIARHVAMQPRAPLPIVHEPAPSIHETPAFVHEEGGELVDFGEFFPDLPEPETPPAPPDPEPEPELVEEDDEPVPQAVARARARRAAADPNIRHIQGVTIAPKPLSKVERAEAETLDVPETERPKIRGDCTAGGSNEARPCGWVSCRYHLAIDVNAGGGLKLNFADREVWEMEETCALDVAEKQGVTLERIAALSGLTRERIRQQEERGLIKLGRHKRALEDYADGPPSGDSNLARAAEN